MVQFSSPGVNLVKSHDRTLVGDGRGMGVAGMVVGHLGGFSGEGEPEHVPPTDQLRVLRLELKITWLL